MHLPPPQVSYAKCVPGFNRVREMPRYTYNIVEKCVNEKIKMATSFCFSQFVSRQCIGIDIIFITYAFSDVAYAVYSRRRLTCKLTRIAQIIASNKFQNDRRSVKFSRNVSKSIPVE
jgi:hypothetical protein